VKVGVEFLDATPPGRELGDAVIIHPPDTIHDGASVRANP
jgi:hypothetical protein